MDQPMRIMRFPEILTAFLILALVLSASTMSAGFLYGRMDFFGEFRVIVCGVAWLFLNLVYALLVMRGFLRMFPLPTGVINLHSREEYIYHVYLLTRMFFFDPYTRSNIVPVPFLRAIYRAMGAKIDTGTYPAGYITDPLFTRLGKQVTIGHNSTLTAHEISGNKLLHDFIDIEDGATVGANSFVMPGVKIGVNAIVAANSVVPRNMQIPAYEIWGGIPVKKIGEVKREHEFRQAAR